MPSKRRDGSAAAALSLPPAVATALRGSLPDVAAVTVTAVVAEVPDYAGPLRGELGANITHAVELALATFLRLAEEPATADRARLLPALEAAYSLGRGEARSGRTMTALLSAYRVGARVAWEQWGSRALAAKLPAQQLVPFAALVFAYIDELSAASVNGHSEELATTGRVREQYLERLAAALVAGAAVDDLERRADRAGWEPPRTLTCVIATAAHTASVRSQLEPATLSIAGDVVDAGLPDDAVIHLVPDLGRRRDALCRQLVDRAWVVGPERPWSQASRSFDRARRALAVHGRQPTAIDTELRLADLVVAADPDARADLRAQVLQPLSSLKPDTAARLAQTLGSWLLHQGRRDDVARELIVHPQTVRYRMSQIRELFGDRLNDPSWVRDVIVALDR